MDETERQQAVIFSQYLTGEAASDEQVKLFRRAVSTDTHPVSRPDDKIYRVAVRHPRLLGLLDSGTALLRPRCLLRRRLYLMFGIMEASPRSHQLFLPQPRRAWYIIWIGLRAARAGVLAVIGGGLVLLLERLP